MIRTNVKRIVRTSVMGEVTHPHMGGFGVSANGEPRLSIGMSGILYNVKVGDTAFGWPYADHVEPGVSIRNSDKGNNRALNILACLGNTAKIVSAAIDKKIMLKTGTVTGKHGGADRVMVHFPKNIMEKLCIGDKILVMAEGLGTQIEDFPQIMLSNMSPSLLKALDLKKAKDRLRVPVKMAIPAKMMGSGLGTGNILDGDYDIQSNSPEAVSKYGIDRLLLGDIVAIQDHYGTFGPHYRKGAVTIGSIGHGASSFSGHGPGVNVMMSCPDNSIMPVISGNANLKNLLNLY